MRECPRDSQGYSRTSRATELTCHTGADALDLRDRCTDYENEVLDVLLGQIRRVPCNRAVVGVVMQNGQTEMSSGGGDNKVYRGRAAVVDEVTVHVTIGGRLVKTAPVEPGRRELGRTADARRRPGRAAARPGHPLPRHLRRQRDIPPPPERAAPRQPVESRWRAGRARLLVAVVWAVVHGPVIGKGRQLRSQNHRPEQGGDRLFGDFGCKLVTVADRRHSRVHRHFRHRVLR